MRSSKSSLLHYSILSVLALTVSIVILQHAPDLNTAFDDPGRSKFRQTLGDVDNFNYNQANAVVNHLPSSEAESATHEHGNNHKVSYVTSFWAQMKDERITSHRREVVAALLANIHNPHFDEIVVFLDRQHDTDSSCLDVHSSMERRSQQIYGMSAEASNVLLNSKFKCIEMQTGQPTYYQMFQNALSEVVTGDVVVLSNGDIAFDDTMSLARYLNPEVLAVLGTHGFSDKMPTNIKHIYEEMLGNNPIRRKSRSDLWDTNRCERTPLSWDTYIFHKSKLLGKLKEEDFKRVNQNHENVHFYMNENGAENAALWALQQSYPFSSTYNACDRIHSWHFHSAPKMHKARDVLWLGNREQVPKPWGEYARKDADCVDTDSCFYVNRKVSYVTSFWAKKRGEEITPPHRQEVVAALLANIHNPHFDEVVVFLDRKQDTYSSCLDFRRSMERLSRQAFRMSAKASDYLLTNKLKCVDVYNGQPTYYQMFQNALSEVVTGDVVVLSNGDIAFDDTMSLARYLNPEVLAVLGTHGFSRSTPRYMKYIYRDVMGFNREEWEREMGPEGSDRNKCESTSSSWDTYIFHKSKLLGRLKEENFKRRNVLNEHVHFYMNEMGAENAALWAVEQSYPFSSTYNACDRIRSWHFHLTPKMHKGRIGWRKPKDVSSISRMKAKFVPEPWGEVAQKNPDCVRTESCFLK